MKRKEETTKKSLLKRKICFAIENTAIRDKN
jgi:hypothetical protein